jgi:zinc resistance-associated protein
MLKPVIAATAMLALAGSSFVYAQQRFDGHGGFGNGGPRAEHHHRHRLSADDISAFGDARIAALKAGLELTPDQARNWGPFESALRNMVQLRVQRVQARQAADNGQPQAQTPTQTPTSPFDRLGHRADTMSKMGAALKQIADSGAPLYQSLTDQQKTRFTMLARMLRPHEHQHASNGGGRDGRGDGRHFGQNGQGGRQFGQDGQGWGQGGRRFGQDGGQGWGHDGRGFGQEGRDGGQQGRFGQDGRGWGGQHRFGENGRGPGGQWHNLSNDGDQDSDSQL